MSSCLFESRINLKKNFNGYHTTGKNASVTTAIICGQKTCQLGLCSHVKDIVPLSYRSDFWNEIVDYVYTNSVLNRTSFWDNILKQGVGKGKSFSWGEEVLKVSPPLSPP